MPEKYTADRCTNLAKASHTGEVSLNTFARNGYPSSTKLDPRQLDKLCTIGTWDIKENKDWGLDWHRNEGIEITFTMSGNLDFQTRYVDKKLSSNMLTITRPWQEHRLGAPNLTANKLFWLIIDVEARQPNHKWKFPDWICLEKDDLIYLEKAITTSKDCVWTGNKKVENIIKDIDNFIKSYNGTDSMSFMRIKINELLFECVNILKLKPSIKTYDTTAYTIEIFLEDIAKDNEKIKYKWTIEEMAKVCATNQTTFFDLCKKITNFTPTNYLNSIRVDKSIQLMKENPDMSLTDISAECGFYTSQYFSTVFKQIMKCSPLKFKKNLKPNP